MTAYNKKNPVSTNSSICTLKGKVSKCKDNKVTSFCNFIPFGKLQTHLAVHTGTRKLHLAMRMYLSSFKLIVTTVPSIPYDFYNTPIQLEKANLNGAD